MLPILWRITTGRTSNSLGAAALGVVGEEVKG